MTSSEMHGHNTHPVGLWRHYDEKFKDTLNNIFGPTGTGGAFWKQF